MSSTRPREILRMRIDLAGSNRGPAFLSTEASGTWPGTDDEVRRMAADYYGIPIEQVGPVARECDHEFQHHPASDDYGVCSHCGAEEALCAGCGATLNGLHDGDYCGQCEDRP